MIIIWNEVVNLRTSRSKFGGSASMLPRIVWTATERRAVRSKPDNAVSRRV